MNTTINRRAALTACLALAVTPALAGAKKPSDPGSHGKGHELNAAAPSHGHGKGRCRKPAVAKGFVASGTYGESGTWEAVANPDGTSTGSVGFTVTHTNHHAAGATGPFAFTNARVVFDSATATAPAATDTVRVLGKILVAKKGCTSDQAGTVTVRRVIFSAPEATDGAPSEPADGAGTSGSQQD
jgi:hypothetical protein